MRAPKIKPLRRKPSALLLVVSPLLPLAAATIGGGGAPSMPSFLARRRLPIPPRLAATPSSSSSSSALARLRLLRGGGTIDEDNEAREGIIAPIPPRPAATPSSSSSSALARLRLLRGGGTIDDDDAAREGIVARGRCHSDDDGGCAAPPVPSEKCGGDTTPPSIFGVLDLRPDGPAGGGDARGDFLLTFRNVDGDGGDDNDRRRAMHRASFPSGDGDGDGEDGGGDSRADEWAAAALTIGSALARPSAVFGDGGGGGGGGAEIVEHRAAAVLLLVAYDFDAGTTVLHRTAGGVKLLNLVEGMRGDATFGSAGCQIVLLLVPHTRDSGRDESDGDSGDDVGSSPSADPPWDAEGAERLVRRLNELFALGVTSPEGSDSDHDSTAVVAAAAAPLFATPEMIPVRWGRRGDDDDDDDDSAVADAILGWIADHSSPSRDEADYGNEADDGGFSATAEGEERSSATTKDIGRRLRALYEGAGGVGRIAFEKESEGE